MKIDSSLIYKANDQYFALESFWNRVVSEKKITESRARGNVIYRHTFSSICYDISTLPIVQIASIIKRDHASVIHAVRQNESNRRYDSRYESVYIWMYHELSKLLKEHIEDRTQALFSRVRQTNPDIDIDSLIENLNRDWQIKSSLIVEDNKKLKKENEAIVKHNQMLESRNRILESELKRIKNLI